MFVGTQVKLIVLMALAKMIAADGALATGRVEQCLLAQQASEAACLRRVCCRLAWPYPAVLALTQAYSPCHAVGVVDTASDERPGCGSARVARGCRLHRCSCTSIAKLNLLRQFIHR